MSREKGIQEKLKNFFRGFNKGSGGPPKTKYEEYVVLTEEFESELRSDALLQNRVKAAKDLTEICKTRRAESHTIEKIWTLVHDLLKPEVSPSKASKEARHCILTLLSTLCQSQLEKSGALRAKFFTFIKAHNVPEDILPRFQFLKSLTENGRDVSYFDEKIGPFLLEWMSDRQTSAIPVSEFMSFLVNIIKFNQSFLDDDILMGIIQNVCFVSCTCSSKDDVMDCLNVLGAVVCYGSLPPGCLSNFLATLCRTVNIEPLCQTSWKIMRNLLGTHLGHSGLYTMCNFMEATERSDDVSVIRGAVFFVGVSLWGSKIIRSLKYSPNAVLSSFEKALERKHSLITFEVILRVQDLVKSNCENLQTISWDFILQITSKVMAFAKSECEKDDTSSYKKIMKAVNETLDSIESIVDTRGFCGPVDRFYQLVDSSYMSRDIPSVEKLMKYKVLTQLSTAKPGWFQCLTAFTEKHLRQEVRSSLKAKALNLITKICLANMSIYEEDLIDKIILPHMKNLENDGDPAMRQSGVKFVLDFLMESSSKKGHNLLRILEKIVNRPYEIHAQSGSDTVHIFAETEVLDIVTAIDGIVQLFKKKIYHTPSSIAITAYKILVRHLENHYNKPAVLDNCSTIRYLIFECYFQIRANSLYHLGFPTRGAKVVAFSPYLAVDHRDGDEKFFLDQYGLNQEANQSSTQISNSISNSGSGSVSASGVPLSGPSPSGPVVTYLSLAAACKLVVSSLKKEKDWKVLELVLTNLPRVLENKALILSKHGNDVDFLATALCAMVTDNSLNLPQTLRNCPSKFSHSDFQAYLFPILTALVSYHTHLESSTQVKIVKCLQKGLVSKCCRICILALTICTLEMKDTMHKSLPEVLLNLSKISPKVNIAIPVLEFLSTLIHLPRVFASFVQDQYLSIFVIALPYTNPFKFNQYTVSLAHHVIAMWFLKCRLPFRRGFVSYIIRGLDANVWSPIEEESRRHALELKNEDSSLRKRSSSLTEQSQKRRERPISGHTNVQPHQPGVRGVTAFDAKPSLDKSLTVFHQELTETCIDFMARYAFADCSALPTRFVTTNFLISGGLSQSWMLDNRIVTITTSGCTQKELRDGLCDKCFQICRKQQHLEDGSSGKSSSRDNSTGHALGRSLSVRGVNDTGTGNASATSLANRRRHRSAFAGVVGQTHSLRKPDGSYSSHKLGAGNGDGSEKKEAKDDMHLDNRNKLQNIVGSDAGVGDENGVGSFLGGSSPFLPAFLQKTKNESMLCTCWCAGWAEVLIRSPSGNTSWMMRVQNHVGNNNTADIPIKDLSSIYLQNIVDTCQTESYVGSSATSSTLSSPTQTQQPPLLVSQNSTSQDSVLTGSETLSPTAPGTPTTPDSPEDPETAGSSRKIPVRRSNSSPEMSSTWKPPHLNLQKDIQEQDEEELTISIKHADEPGSTSCTSIFSGPLSSESSANKNGSSKSSFAPIPTEYNPVSTESNMPTNTSPPQAKSSSKDDSGSSYTASSNPTPIKGNTSPFRRSYDAIPEESVQKTGSLGSSPEGKSQVEVIVPMKRDRMATISVMTPARRNPVRRIMSVGGEPTGSTRFGGSGEVGFRTGISPSFVFLQLCAQGIFGRGDKPLLLPTGETTAKSLRVLDYIPPYETHKIGVVYVGPGQACNETAILQNQYGSARYRDFLQGLGTLIKLKEIDPQKTYIGGLSKDGGDGEFACIWQDDVMQVIFHTATLMPNKPSDPNGNSKKLHIGNDYVTIVYNNSEEDYEMSTIKGQFLYACVVVQPLDHKTNRVTVKARPDLAEHIGHMDAKVVSDQNLPIMARQLALHANLASVIFQKMQTQRADPYASNWLERLRQIKRLKSRLFPDSGLSSSEELSGELPSGNPSMKRLVVEDFTEFV